VTYAISGGADAARFTINASTGALSFVAAPNFEAPADADGDNVYDVVVSASDGSFTDTQAIAVTVGDINELPVITSNGGGATAALVMDPGLTEVTTVTAVDFDGPATVTYAIAGGVDAALFAIDAETGALRFLTAPALEAPADAGANNVYDVTVAASDGAASDLQALSITIRNPAAFAQTAFAGLENNPVSAALALADGIPDLPVVYTIAGGPDAARFVLDPDGTLQLAPQNYEAPADADHDNVYQVSVTAQQGGASITALLSVTVKRPQRGAVVRRPDCVVDARKPDHRQQPHGGSIPKARACSSSSPAAPTAICSRPRPAGSCPSSRRPISSRRRTPTTTTSTISC
jgi:hypothetical protein